MLWVLPLNCHTTIYWSKKNTGSDWGPLLSQNVSNKRLNTRYFQTAPLSGYCSGFIWHRYHHKRVSGLSLSGFRFTFKLNHPAYSLTLLTHQNCAYSPTDCPQSPRSFPYLRYHRHKLNSCMQKNTDPGITGSHTLDSLFQSLPEPDYSGRAVLIHVLSAPNKTITGSLE